MPMGNLRISWGYLEWTSSEDVYKAVSKQISVVNTERFESILRTYSKGDHEEP